MEKRFQKFQAVLKEKDLDAYYVTDLYNIRYLSGFTGSTATLFITQNAAYVLTDFRYEQQVKNQCQGYEAVIAGGSASNTNPMDFLKQVGESLPNKRIGFEAEKVSFSEYNRLKQAVPVEWVPAPGLIEKLREVKDEEEIATIRKACQIADAAFDYILTYLKPGLSEIQVANALDFKMRELGASGVSFTTIVASGLRSAMPHGVASEKILEKGDLVTMDYGCYYKGYASDMTRTVALGDPGEKLKEIYSIVQEANRRVAEAVRPGITGAELDAKARDFIAEKGYGSKFGHSTGHAFGLEVHETPYVSFRSDQPFVVGNCITDEPGIYIEGLGGVRIEDDFLVVEGGSEILTHSPRELIIL